MRAMMMLVAAAAVVEGKNFVFDRELEEDYDGEEFDRELRDYSQISQTLKRALRQK